MSVEIIFQRGSYRMPDSGAPPPRSVRAAISNTELLTLGSKALQPKFFDCIRLRFMTDISDQVSADAAINYFFQDGLKEPVHGFVQCLGSTVFQFEVIRYQYVRVPDGVPDSQHDLIIKLYFREVGPVSDTPKPVRSKVRKLKI